jgi:PTH1 family peptidyl-tRNA hydrolase
MKMVVGLGNPGPAFRFTRHNLGFLVLERLARRHKIALSNRSYKALWGKGRVGRNWVLLVKPMTFMNLSGPAVAALCKIKKVKTNQMLIVCDDVNLSKGRLRIKPEGSDGGHKGLRSIIESIGSYEVARLRIGVGNGKVQSGELSDFLLEPFNKRELVWLESVIETAGEAVETWITEGVITAMNKYNRHQSSPAAETS